MCWVQVTWHTLCMAREKGGCFAAAVATAGIAHFANVVTIMVIEPDSQPSHPYIQCNTQWQYLY